MSDDEKGTETSGEGNRSETNRDGNESTHDLDPVTLEVFRNRLEGIAEEMGEVLIRGAYSPNITERRDCSTALFDADGRLVAQAEHIPVHLGAMPRAVEAVLERDPGPGDVFVHNDPFAGGTHLPDVTLVSPLAPGDEDDGEGDDEREILGYAVSRAHHADIGGMAPGSMPAGTREIYQEGLRLPPVRLVREGERDEALFETILANVRGTAERRADLSAQLAANERAGERLEELLAEYGGRGVKAGFEAVRTYSRERVETELASLPDGTYRAVDFLEGDGVTDDDLPIEVAVTIDGTAVEVDFSGTADQVAGNLNAPLSVATSAVYFVVRCLTDPEIPANEGCYEPITVTAPAGSLVNPEPPAAVVGGNVETSQRVADVTFLAFAEAAPGRVPAQGQGTMNNLTIGSRGGSGAGSSGADGGSGAGSSGANGGSGSGSGSGGANGGSGSGSGGPEAFTYYETIAGGFGARPGRDGMDGVQVGMTNTLNTPVEALEDAYPLRVDRYALRPGSGGAGEYRGGLGLERRLRVETDATVSLLTERRRHRPQGVAGGEPGAAGENLIDGEAVASKVTVEVEPGTTVTVRTPGGGGHGGPAARDPALEERDRRAGVVDPEAGVVDPETGVVDPAAGDAEGIRGDEGENGEERSDAE